ncbi:ROK family transcriptional regulator [Egicoccus halophilus]|uniref:Sugar kinase n=1 Tax=Egicoccus halophilus TaxID=1670830 RepID=A0A8J3A7J9_9ACTN|nr:ROK family transcriptional regulator [Egicoccus halophilus]GGI03463.1 sugar kinase [Egicoccus halophilus]
MSDATTTVRPPMPAPGSAGHLLQLLRDSDACTRPQLVELSGISRSAVSQRIEALLAAGLVVQDGAGASTGGRPAVRLRFHHENGLVLVADLGATHAQLAVTDLAGTVLAEQAENWAVADGPEPVLDAVRACFDALLTRIGRSRDEVRGIGIGLPGPVEHGSGRAVSPPIMPGWDGFPVPRHFADFDVPVLVDNDVNIMALGEYWTAWRAQVDDLLFIKVGTGIGCGVIASGRVHRGAQGAAGDIGHVRVPDADHALCRCGNTGCVEAVAGGQAIADRLRALGRDAHDARDVVALVKAGDREATRAVREAGRELGRVLAAAVNFFNPAVIVIGGDLANAHEQLLAGVREVVYRRSLPLATRHLRVVPAQEGERAGITGASAMVLAEVLAPSAVDRLVNGVT